MSSSDSPAPLEAVDPALDRAALAVVDRLEMRRATAARTELLAVAGLVGFVLDGAADPTAAQVGFWSCSTGQVQLGGEPAA
ncbi:hypothetical protein [Streptomyces bauhiniae]|uniref:hypothetical protein n=1 Tax=Streptomyces bauhiniae TaxID=2340725 RepID=UPI0036653E45